MKPKILILLLWLLDILYEPTYYMDNFGLSQRKKYKRGLPTFVPEGDGGGRKCVTLNGDGVLQAGSADKPPPGASLFLRGHFWQLHYAHGKRRLPAPQYNFILHIKISLLVLYTAA